MQKFRTLVKFQCDGCNDPSGFGSLGTMGYIQREHGGAFLKGVGSFAKTGQLFNQTHLEEKKEIAQKAIQFIQEGDSIILDSGSTTTEIAKLLMNYKDLTVITNALNIALILGENHGINLIVTGGEFKAPTLSLTGKWRPIHLKIYALINCFWLRPVFLRI